MRQAMKWSCVACDMQYTALHGGEPCLCSPAVDPPQRIEAEVVNLTSETEATQDGAAQLDRDARPDAVYELDGWTMDEAMERWDVPAISVAVAVDGQKRWAQAWGVTEAGTDNPATAETRFQAGSISKSVAAFCALRLVTEGRLELDRDV